MENLIFRHGRIFLANATYTIQFILTIYINSEKPMLPGRCAPVEFFSWKCGKLRKTAKSGYPALIWPFRTSLFSALSWNKISHIKLQSLKMFKTTKDMFPHGLNSLLDLFNKLILSYLMFYTQFDFFANWQGRLWGFVNLVLCCHPSIQAYCNVIRLSAYKHSL